MSSNSLSAVVRVSHNDTPRALLASDIDDIGLTDLERRSVSLTADLLVFPHHGGHIARVDNAAFTERLCRSVSATTVVFSIGRGRHSTPRPEIIRAVEATLPGSHVACTQLSKRCAQMNPDVAREHLVDLPAQGREANVTCTGTIVQDLSTGAVSPDRASHALFVQRHAPTHLCLGGPPPDAPEVHLPTSEALDAAT